YIQKKRYSAVIFPEGTRSKTGKPKAFSGNGLKILFRNIPDGIIIPVTINNSWKLLKHGAFPINTGVHMTVRVQEPFPVNSMGPDELITEVERRIIKDIKL